MMYSFLSLCGLTSEDKYWGGAEKQETYSRLFKSHNHDVASDYVSKVPKESRLWIFTMIRDPFSRAASFFFEADGNDGFLLNSGIDDVEKYVKGFHNSEMLQDDTPWYQKTERDFLSNFHNSTGVLMTGNDFDHNGARLFKSSVIDTKVTNAVLLRMEDIAQWTHVVAEYAPGFVLEEDNQAEDKSELTADMYDQFKSQFMFTDSERARLLASDVLQFYNSTEVASMMLGQMVGFPR
jgi:hypothetical protein